MAKLVPSLFNLMQVLLDNDLAQAAPN
ncbi:MAG: hypothetical protein KR126chlam2_01330, partial [Chlamydiae bacterium]|nr:hypothetical protein [Chlamydiota bacterium]